MRTVVVSLKHLGTGSVLENEKNNYGKTSKNQDAALM